MNKIRLRGRFLSKKKMLQNPDKYMDTPVLCFEVDAPGKLIQYVKEANRDRQIITLEDWPKDPTAQQRKLFFTLRDRLAEHWSPGRMVTRVEKDETYRTIAGMSDLINENGDPVESIEELTSKELSGLIDMLKDWLLQSGVDITDLL